MTTEFPTMKNSPGQLFYSTQIPVCLWSIRENGNASAATFVLN